MAPSDGRKNHLRSNYLICYFAEPCGDSMTNSNDLAATTKIVNNDDDTERIYQFDFAEFRSKRVNEVVFNTSSTSQPDSLTFKITTRKSPQEDFQSIPKNEKTKVCQP